MNNDNIDIVTRCLANILRMIIDESKDTQKLIYKISKTNEVPHSIAANIDEEMNSLFQNFHLAEQYYNELCEICEYTPAWK